MKIRQQLLGGTASLRTITAAGPLLGKPDIERTLPNDRVLTHLRHQRAIFAVMHTEHFGATVWGSRF
jgi:hypothetical protein